MSDKIEINKTPLMLEANANMEKESKHSSYDIHDSENDTATAEPLSKTQKLKLRFPWYRIAVHVLVGCFFTAWWLSIIIQKKT